MPAKLPTTATHRPTEKENVMPTAEVPSGTTHELHLDFTDHDEFIEQREVNAKTNPFQAKVNELAQTGKAASVLLPETDVKWARESLRRAANNINKGARTKVVPETNPKRPDVKHVRIHFVVGEMQKRPRS